MPERLQLLLITIAAGAVGALCVYGGVRLVLQGEWGWGVALAGAGGWTAFKSVRSYRAAVTSSGEPGPGSDRGDRRDR
jgi:hypothetical protein